MAGVDDSDWHRKGATLSDKTACREYGLTPDEIAEGIRAGQLQYRQNAAHGNPFLRLLRREVELLVRRKHGAAYLQSQLARTELAGINRELNKLKKQIATLEARKSTLLADLGK